MLIRIHCTTTGGVEKIITGKHKQTTVARLQVKCVAADIVGLQTHAISSNTFY